MSCQSIGNLDTGANVGVLLATYCEAQNIERLIVEIESLPLDSLILVVDDSSPDGTANIVEALQNKYQNVSLVIRPVKLGLGTAITDGFKVFLSLKKPPKYVVVMDADYSHNPQDIPRLLSQMEDDTGLVIGSRYCKGGRIQGWPITRHLVSRTANILARLVAGLKLNDCTSGFRCYSTAFLSAAIGNLHCTTYEIQIETASQASLQGFRIKEAPMLFVNRKQGKSKLSSAEISGFVSYILRKIRNRYARMNFLNEAKANRQS